MEVLIMIFSTMTVKQPWTWLELMRPAGFFPKYKKLELKCTAARAVKKFGLPYLGMVPKTLEKYLSMH